MSEEENFNKEPKFIEIIEEILNSLVSFLLNFPLVTYIILFRSSKIFEQDFKIKSLTYFAVNLLLSSAFWYYYFLPDESFISPLILYLLEPNISEIKNYFFNTDSLTTALISLIPIILITNVIARLITLCFKIYSRVIEFLKFSFYLFGLILIGFPIITFLIFIIVPKTYFNFFKFDLFESEFYVVFSWVILGTFTVLLLKIIWIGTKHLIGWDKKYWYLKPILFYLIFVSLCYFNLKIVSFFYTEKKADIESDIKQLESDNFLTATTTNYTIILGVVLTNKSENDQVVNLNLFNISIGNENKYEIFSKASFNEIRTSSQPLSQVFILKHHSAAFFKIPFRLNSHDCKILRNHFKNQYLSNNAFIEGSVDIKFEILNDNFAKIENTELRNIKEEDIGVAQ